jgi:hypothetical protein
LKKSKYTSSFGGGGIICSCTLALPAFFDQQFPNGLHPYFSRLASLFTSRNKSRGTGYASNEANGSTRRLHQDFNGPGRSNYWELESKKGHLDGTNEDATPRTRPGDLEAASGKLGRNPYKTAVTATRTSENWDGDDWPEGRIVKTVGLNQHDGR